MTEERKNDEIADAHRNQEVNVIDGCGHDVVARVAMRGHGAGQIDPVHQASAQQGGERIGVIRQNDFRHFGLRIPHRAGRQRSRRS